MYDYRFTAQDARDAWTHADGQRSVVWRWLEENRPEVFDSYDAPEWTDKDFILEVARAVDGKITTPTGGRLQPSRLAAMIGPWFARPHHYSPTIDVVAVDRALDGDFGAYESLTALERRIMVLAIVRLTWQVWRYGTETAAEISATLGGVDVHSRGLPAARAMQTDRLSIANHPALYHEVGRVQRVLDAAR